MITPKNSSLIELNPVIEAVVSKADRIYSFLKHHILTCKLQPGQRLNEKELCQELFTSRTPLREALNRLAIDRLVFTGHYQAYIVAPLNVADVVNLCELRAAIEGHSGALAAERATPQEVERLSQLAHLPYEPGDRKTYERYLRANSRFHLAVAQCSRNDRLVGLVMSTLDEIQRPLYLGLDVGLDPTTAAAEHLEVVEAIRSRNRTLAQYLMSRNASQAKERILMVLVKSGLTNS